MINETVRNEDDQGHRNEDNEDDRKTIDHNQGHRNEVNQGKCNLDDSILSRCEQGGTSSMGDKISLGEDMLCIDIIDQSSDLDGKVEKRLNDMVAIHHVPKINGVIPSVDEETSDHQRLLDRLQLYGLVENKVQGDGNCQILTHWLEAALIRHKHIGRRKNVMGRVKAMGGLKVTNLAFGGNKMFVTRKDQ